MNINRIITEAINDILNEKAVDKFTPYTPEEAEQNKRGIGRMGNPSYDKAKKADTSVKPVKYKSYDDWKNNYKPNGISWSEYKNS
jgi:hypothetical protein